MGLIVEECVSGEEVVVLSLSSGCDFIYHIVSAHTALAMYNCRNMRRNDIPSISQILTYIQPVSTAFRISRSDVSSSRA